jgi:hypothetical protein
VPNWDPITFAIIIAVSLVAAYAMIRMIWAAFGAGAEASEIFSGSAFLARYNRKNFMLFVAAVAVGVGIAVFYNVLFSAGEIPP